VKRSLVAVLCGCAFAMGAVVPASAGTGSGGAHSSAEPVVSGVACIARCAGVDAVQAGSLLRLRGTALGGVRKIVFLGARGTADDVTVRAGRARAKSADVLVPEKATSGPLIAINSDGAQSEAGRAAVSVQTAAAGGGPLDVRVVGRRVFLAAARQAQLDLVARQPLTVAVALVRLNDGAVVQAWPLGSLMPGVLRSVTWDGMIAGVAQPVGRYEFRVFTQGAGAQAAQAVTPLATGAFDLVDHKFPVRGKHAYGTGIAAFGANRGGRSHQGQDVFASCGTPLVAARGGVVKLNQNEADAGNYLVIDGAGTDVDYAYMHLREPSPLKKGAEVLTGQVIGAVGQTGAASGCHLHFEMWSAPGWYTGGEAIDPGPALKLWDAYS